METPSAYTAIISPRSRRLRMIGALLLVGVCAMVLYGYFFLMPSISRSIHETMPTASVRAATPLTPSVDANRTLTRAQKVRKLRVSVALAYWGVCGILLCTVILIAWLDLREISRTYVNERRAMWTQAASDLDRSDSGG